MDRLSIFFGARVAGILFHFLQLGFPPGLSHHCSCLLIKDLHGKYNIKAKQMSIIPFLSA